MTETREQRNERMKKYYYENREKILEYQKTRWKEKYAKDEEFRKKRQLRDKTRIVYGRSLKEEVCIVCGAKEDLQRHHENYDSIDYKVMCRRCHNNHHEHLKVEKGLISQTA